MNCHTPSIHSFEPQVQIVVVRGDGTDCDLAHGDQRSVRTRAESHAVRFSFRLDETEIFFRNEVGVNVDRDRRVN